MISIARCLMITKYLSLKVSILFLMLTKRKVSFRKLTNALWCYVSCWLGLKIAARTPLLINFELSNHCNEKCVFCRTNRGQIFDLNPSRAGKFIPKGMMKIEVLEGIVRETKDTLLMAIPYVNGEPFIYKDLYRVLRILKENKVAAILSTNGLLLNDDNIAVILDNDLDLIKIHVSGFTNPVHQVQHRIGDVETIKQNLLLLSQRIQERKARIIVVVDFIRYNHNLHELMLFRKFTESCGFRFNTRPGNPSGMEQSEIKQPEECAQDIPCDWLWKVMTVNWNGDLLPCCDYTVWGETPGYGVYVPGDTSVINIWNGEIAQGMRRTHRRQGRSPIPICSKCNRKGVEYKF